MRMLRAQSTIIILCTTVNCDCSVNYFNRYCKSITKILRILLKADISNSRSKVLSNNP